MINSLDTGNGLLNITMENSLALTFRTGLPYINCPAFAFPPTLTNITIHTHA